jgi:hypothetical protein
MFCSWRVIKIGAGAKLFALFDSRININPLHNKNLIGY